MKISAFSFCDVNRSKSQPIVLKFGTDRFFISSNRVRYRKRSVYYDRRYLRLNIFVNIFESRFLREYFIYQLHILTNYYTHRRLYFVKISGDYLSLFSRNKILLKENAFSFSDNNRSKSQPIVLKFGTQIDFLYLRISL